MAQDLNKILREVASGKKLIGSIHQNYLRDRVFVIKLLEIAFPSGRQKSYFTRQVFEKLPEDFKSDPEILKLYLRQIKILYPDSNMRSYIDNTLTYYGLKISDELMNALIEANIIDKPEKKIESKQTSKNGPKAQKPPKKIGGIKGLMNKFNEVPDNELWYWVEMYEAEGKKVDPYDLKHEYVLELIKRDARFFRLLRPLYKNNKNNYAYLIGLNPGVVDEIQMYEARLKNGDVREPKKPKEPKPKEPKPKEPKPKEPKPKEPKPKEPKPKELKPEGPKKPKDTRAEKKRKALHDGYRTQKQNHPDIKLILDFLESMMSIDRFCDEKGIWEAQFREIVIRVGEVYPKLQQAVEFVEEQFRKVFETKAKNDIEKICAGEMTIKEFAANNWGPIKVNELLVLAEGKKLEFKKLLFEAMESGTLTMMDYVRLFSIEGSAEDVRKQVKILFEEIDDRDIEVGIDENLRNKARGKSNVFILNYMTPLKSPKMLGITTEQLEYIEKHLKNSDEYICASTISNAIPLILSGELSFKEIDARVKLEDEKQKARELSIELDVALVRATIAEMLKGEFGFGEK